MTGVLSLGPAPGELHLRLLVDADFDATLTLVDAAGDDLDFTDGDVVHLVLDANDYPATMDGPHATWHLDADDVNDLLDEDVANARVELRSDAGNIVWFTGMVNLDAASGVELDGLRIANTPDGQRVLITPFPPSEFQALSLALGAEVERATTAEEAEVERATTAEEAEATTARAAELALRDLTDSTLVANLSVAHARARPTRAATLSSRPMHYHHFGREDRADLTGLKADSGHLFSTSTDGNPAVTRFAVIDGEAVPLGVQSHGVAGQVLIAYLSRDKPIYEVEFEFRWRGGILVPARANVVGGAAPRGFGTTSSVQLQFRADGTWSLFCPDYPTTGGPDPYTVIDEGEFAPGFQFDLTGATKYPLVMRRTDVDKVTLELPDETTKTVVDDTIHPYSGRSHVDTCWGDVLGMQFRAGEDVGFVSSEDVGCSFTSIASAEVAA